MDHAVQSHGRIDVIINNAGLMPFSPLERLKVQDWDRTIDVNLKGVLYGIAAALPHMKAQRSGHIINVSSVAGHKVGPGGVVYAATNMRCESSRRDCGRRSSHTTSEAPSSRRVRSRPNCPTASPNPTSRRTYANSTSVAISADSFANMVVFAMSQPEDVDVNEILFRPTRQEY